MDAALSPGQRLNYSRFSDSNRKFSGLFLIALYFMILISNFICVTKLLRYQFKKWKRNRRDTSNANSYGKAHVFIIVLTSSNIFFPLILAPILLLPNFTGKWLGEDFACHTSTFLLVFWTNVSTILSLYMGLERYIAVKKPFRYQQILTWYNIILVIILMAIYCVAIATLTIQFDMIQFYEQVPLCYIHYNLTSIDQQGVIITGTFTHSISFIILTYTSVVVLRELKQMHNRVRQITILDANQPVGHGQHLTIAPDIINVTRKTGKVIVLITAVHLLAWLPGRVCSID